LAFGCGGKVAVDELPGTPRVCQRLAAEYDSLSPGLKVIAKFILDRWVDVAFMSTRQIGSALSVSESLVVKLGKRLGYSGFAEIQRELREAARAHLGRAEYVRRRRIADSEEDLILQTYRTDLENLRQTLIRNPPGRLVAATNLIMDAERVYVVGARNAGAVAAVAAIHLNEVLGNVFLLAMPFGNGLDYLRGASQRDVVIAVSLPQYSSWTVQVVRYGHSRGTKILALTDSLSSPLAAVADVTLLVSCDSPTFALSHVSTLALINILVALVAQRLGERCLPMLKELDEVSSQEGVLRACLRAAQTKSAEDCPR
jgi:DNA-binding MurR/RpiR family transcriptional regulator